MVETSFDPQNRTKFGLAFSNGRKIINIAKSLLPVLLLVAILPVFYGFAVNPPDLSFYSKAGSEGKLRLWFEPANTVTQAGKEVELTVYAEFDGEGEIPSLTFNLDLDTEISVDKKEMVHLQSFNGKTALGKIFVRAQVPGQYKLTIPESKVEITGIDDRVEISAASANFIVR